MPENRVAVLEDGVSLRVYIHVHIGVLLDGVIHTECPNRGTRRHKGPGRGHELPLIEGQPKTSVVSAL